MTRSDVSAGQAGSENVLGFENAERIVVLGYSDWRNFTDCIRKARQQVESHVSAGRAEGGDVTGFVNAEQIVTGSAVARAVLDVHLTRFAAYFVALNADQSKPEVRAAVNYYFVGRTIQAEQMVAAAEADPDLTAQNAKRIVQGSAVARTVAR